MQFYKINQNNFISKGKVNRCGAVQHITHNFNCWPHASWLSTAESRIGWLIFRILWYSGNPNTACLHWISKQSSSLSPVWRSYLEKNLLISEVTTNPSAHGVLRDWGSFAYRAVKSLAQTPDMVRVSVNQLVDLSVSSKLSSDWFPLILLVVFESWGEFNTWKAIGGWGLWLGCFRWTCFKEF